MEQRCPICLDDVSKEDEKCCKCETLYHAECKPKDLCATCRYVYDKTKKNETEVALINHFNDNLTYEDIGDPDEDEEDDEEDDDIYGS